MSVQRLLLLRLPYVVNLFAWAVVVAVDGSTRVAQGAPPAFTHDAPSSPQPGGLFQREDTETMF